jgi:DNA-binding response OmpR family regulator/tRNA A-37 threonylcarbamoyl transferase component Bud32
MSDLVGRYLGQYEILEQIARGSISTIYKAYQLKLERYVAIKVLFPHVIGEEDVLERFVQEAHAIAQLDHPNIVTVYDFDRLDDTVYLVMKYVEGGSLGRLMNGHSMELGLAVELISQVGLALAYAHRHGIIHRDVKPGNILIAEKHWAMLADFGLVKLLTGSKNLTRSNLGMGTPTYIAPEQAEGLSPDHRADIYALGATLYEMVAGRPPFEAKTPMAILVKHLTELPTPPHRYNPDLPAALEGLILAALEKDPARRPQTAQDFVDALKASRQQPVCLRDHAWKADRGHPAPPAQPAAIQDSIQENSILVVDDQVELLDGLKLALEAAGSQVLTATDGVEALEILRAQTVDLILADIAMPRMNGYQLYEHVRQNPGWTLIPFVFLTARTLDSDIRYGKELGVDDYLTKPIRPEDLLATVSGKLRRARQLAHRSGSIGPTPLPDEVVSLGALKIDPGRHQAWLSEHPLRLSAREFILLEYLARHAGTVVPPCELVQVTHGLDTGRLKARTLLRSLIRSLRRKLGYTAGDMGCIENVRGVGYRLITPGG